MISKIVSWVSRVSRLALIARSTYLAMKEDVRMFAALAEEAKDIADRFMQRVSDLEAELSSKRAEVIILNQKLIVAADRLHVIAENDALTNGTARKLTTIAKEALVELEGKEDEELAA